MKLTAEQQRELDAWIASMEQCYESVDGRMYVKGYNDGCKAAAEAIQQGNWTWEEYQECLKKQQENADKKR